MKSIASLQKKANATIEGAWVTLGLPFGLPMIDEMDEGIIDVEALIMTTLLMMEQGRIVTDLPAWLSRFSSLINNQKLKTIFRTLPQEHRTVILEKLSQATFHGAPKSFKNIFNLIEPSTDFISETIHMRLHKVNTIENVAQASIMIQNRLLYGTGFRADLITLTHIEGLSMKGTQLAKMLCTNNSTISRILNDLKACRFLDHDNERVGDINFYPGIFISTLSVLNLCEMIDAFKYSFKELKRDAFENLDLKYDGFGRKVYAEWV